MLAIATTLVSMLTAQPTMPPPAAADAGPMIVAVGPIAVTVSDLDRSVGFFTTVLDFKLESVEEDSGESWERTLGVFGARTRTATLRLGDERVQLIDFLTPEGREIPADSRSNDRWFQHIAIAVSDMDAAYQRVRSAGVRFASSSPQTLPSWNPAAGGISAFYFNDPDRHVLEVIHFPSGKGDPRWQRAKPDDAVELSATSGKNAIFLGIDHTAIVTADADRDLEFYQSVLGLRVAGTSENYGIEQEHLNSVFGAHLRITTLRATTGPGIELLEYLSPTTGREFPCDGSTSDLWHWHVSLTLSPDVELGGAETSLRRAHARWVSGAPDSPDRPLPRVLVRDPDGHALMVSPRPVTTGLVR